MLRILLSRLSAICASVLLIPGCASFRQTEADVVIREPGTRMLGAPEPAQPEAIKDLEFAWLSEASYGNTPAGLNEKQATRDNSFGAASEDFRESCPEGFSQAQLKAAGWRVWPGFPSDGLLEKISKYHLRVEVWNREEPPAVAVAFGGTVFNNRNDWSANLRWFLPKWFQANHPDEYSETVQEFGPAFVEEYKNKAQYGGQEWEFLRRATIYATGHSLGGGLAQQFAYALPIDSLVPRVSHVFAFDPSPVTGFYSVNPLVRDTNRQDLYIERIYERGEILALIRSLTSVIVQPSAKAPTIRGVRYSLFYPASPISGHSMSQLACKMLKASRGEISTTVRK